MNDSRSISRVGQITLLVASTLTVMAGATIAPSLPAMRAAFENTANADFLVRLVLTLPALFIVLGAPFAGAIVDRFGRKPLLLISAILYAVAGSSAVLLDSLVLILVGRALLGFAVAGIMTSVTTLIADYFAGDERQKMLGLQGTFMSLGGVFFLLFGGVMADLNWRYPFLIYLFSLALLPFVWLALREPEKSREANENSIGFFEFLRSHSSVFAIFALAFFGMAAFYLIPVQAPFHLQQISEASGASSGAAIAASNLFGALAAFRYKNIRARFGFLQIYAAAFALMAIGYAIIGAANNYAVVLGAMAITGLGAGLLLPNASSWLASLVDENLRGRAIGALTMAIFLGQFVSPFYSQPLAASVGVANSFFAVAAALAAIAALVAAAALRQTTVGEQV